MSFFFRWLKAKKDRVIDGVIPTTSGGWENQSRTFWEDINTLWGELISVVGTFKFWEEQTKEFWQLESTVNYEDWFETQGSLEMIEEKESDNWNAISGINWENLQ